MTDWTRVHAERAIAGAKINRIVKDVFHKQADGFSGQVVELLALMTAYVSAAESGDTKAAMLVSGTD